MSNNLPAVATPSAIAISESSRPISVFSGGDAFTSAQRMAKALASSSLVPAQYQGEQNIGNCLIALEIAGRIGASVLAVMQSLDIIHGRPSWRATFLIGTVNTCGRFTPMRFRFSGTEGQDDWGCRAVAKDKDSGEELVGACITVALAKAEGWAGKTGSKWKTMPEQMLQYRAASFWTRAYAPELSLGMHTQDEVRDGLIDVTPETDAPRQVGQRRTHPVALPEALQSAAEPDPDPVNPPTPATVAPVDPVTAPPDSSLDDRRQKFRDWLGSLNVTEGQFLLVASQHEDWPLTNGQPIAEFDEVTLNWCKAKARIIKEALLKDGGAQ